MSDVVLVGIADEFGTIWAGEPGVSERIGDLVTRSDGETAEVRVRFPIRLVNRTDTVVLGRCSHGVDLDREFCPEGCRV